METATISIEKYDSLKEKERSLDELSKEFKAYKEAENKAESDLAAAFIIFVKNLNEDRAIPMSALDSYMEDFTLIFKPAHGMGQTKVGNGKRIIEFNEYGVKKKNV